MYTEDQRQEHILGLQKDLRVIHANTGDRLPYLSGKYDHYTEEAVRLFQTRHNLPITGKTDLSTWDQIVHEANQVRSQTAIPLAVRIFPHASLTVGAGDRGRFVYILQAMLNSLAQHFPSLLPLSYTGIYDAPTEQAIAALQRTASLPVTGQLNADTWNILADLYSHLMTRTHDILD